MTLIKFLNIIISIPKTVYFNFKVLPIRSALHFPFFVHYSISLGELNKTIYISENKFFSIILGLGGSDGIINQKGFFSCGKDSKIVFNGTASFGRGSSIRVDQGCLVFGNNFSANKNCFISCSNKIIFGEAVLLGFNISVRDSDGHMIFHNGIAKLNTSEVVIGSHVWIASHTHLLKGTTIADDCVVAYGSIIWGKFNGRNCLIGGYPAKILQTNIVWQK